MNATLSLKRRTYNVNAENIKNIKNIKTWAQSTFTPGSAKDVVRKEAAWLSFANYSQMERTLNNREQFFSLFGQHVAGQDQFEAVSSNRKRKSFVGLRFKESSLVECGPPPKRALLLLENYSNPTDDYSVCLVGVSTSFSFFF